MKMSEQFAGNYFKATDLPQPRVLTIQAVTDEKMPDGVIKPVMRFVGEQQMLVLNKTNAFLCVELFGDETSAWPGMQIELYATTTSFSGRTVQCIRLRAPQQQLPQYAVPQVPQQAVTTQPQAVPQQAVPTQPQQVQQQPPMQAPPADYPVDA